MKKTIFLTVTMALATFGAFAQQEAGTATPRARATVEERAKMQADRINTTVQLTPDQYTKVLDIIKNFAAQKDALRKAGPPSDETKAKMKTLNQQEEAQINTILTPAQSAKLQAVRKEHQGHRPE